VVLANMMNALSRGVETMATAQLTHWWQVHFSHAYMWKELTFDPGSADPTKGASEANDPSNIVKVRSYINATKRIEIDTFFRYYGSRPQPSVDSYSELDTRLGYRVRQDGICR
jgi:outer membrane receptor for ferrienterochelin and colicin